MESVKKYFKRSNSGNDDPGSIESIERARNKAKKKKERPPALKDIPKLTKELLLQSSTSASASQSDIVDELIAINAAKKLYDLCDVGHKSNREPMVSSGKYDVIGPLTQCLLHESTTTNNTRRRIINTNTNTNTTMASSSSSESSYSLTSSTSHSQSQLEGKKQQEQHQQQQPKIIDDDDDDDDDLNDDDDDDDYLNDEKKNVNGTKTETETDDCNDDPDTATDDAAGMATKTITKIGDDDKNNIDDDDNENNSNSNNNNNNNNVQPTSAISTATTTTPKVKKLKPKVKKLAADEKLHFVCLILNNLSIPHDNKRVMVKERGAKKLIGNLCRVIASGKKEAYLCCIILMNLSFYEPGLVIIGQFSPSSPPPPPPPTTTTISNISTTPISISMQSSTSTSNTQSNAATNNSSHANAKKAVTAIATTAVSTAVSTAVTTKTILANAVGKGQRKLTPLENPHSLLRILQDLISNVEHGTSDFRWSFGLLANLSKHPENALLIGLTGIPRVAIDNIRRSLSLSQQQQSQSQSQSSPSPSPSLSPSMWNTNSLEDFSLYFLLHLSEICPSNILNGALDVVIPIMDDCAKDHKDNSNSNGDNKYDTNNNNNIHNSKNGIQSLKATMICAFLGLEWEKFPDHGIIAAGTVSELMANTFERVGKKQVYTDNDFSLRTAVSAYAALAKAASKADSLMNMKVTNAVTTNETTPATTIAPSQLSCSHTKVMALPTSVALLFQIINAIALNWGDEENDKNKDYETYHWDIKAGDLAVGAVMSLLPALLEGEKQKYQQNQSSQGTQQACADLSKVFVFFSKKTNSISAKARSMEIAEKLTESSASGRSLPLLECAYDLSRTSSTHRIQKNFL